ncbi:hypothetical protein [Pectobacterium parmentieri]|uniref:hypothetical protein n=1 Tax=Pectobacterium parmentieri TaxID=1905730 RepID=UPI0018E03E8A|nr:hypothetical protein [Pectobacterium parmentieri]MBI0551401.1 hypothetical protein [Pectobacterium parmentieri]MBI0557687.1 hypothetical protein [Pectobacterium parmentieri]MBI0564041.1 hypothetical protein [Pectobacterium parmentieri]
MTERDSTSEPRVTEVKEPQRHYTVGSVKNRLARNLSSAASDWNTSILTSDSPLSSSLSAVGWSLRLS